MGSISLRNLFLKFVLTVSVVLVLPLNAFATTSVKAIALFNDKAMLSVDGRKAKIIRAGSTYAGVSLISSNTTKAVVEVDGKRETLTLNGTLVLSKSFGAQASSSYGTAVELFVNEDGFFQSQGSIDAKPINFLVDTGANLVVISSVAANQIQLEYLNGKKTFASTASGRTPMYIITAKSIRIGGIELENVEMGVIEGRFPEYPLLGMTFLSRLNMQRSGDVMTLRRR